MKKYALVEFNFDELLVNSFDLIGSNNNNITNMFPIQFIVEIILSCDCYSFRSDDLIIPYLEYMETNEEIYDTIDLDLVTLTIDLIAQALDDKLKVKLSESYCNYKFFRWIDDKNMILEEQ